MQRLRLDEAPDLAEPPAISSFVQADREHRVVGVERDAERGEADVYLREDGDDLKMQVIPEAHLACVDLMKRDGWEDEAAVRAWLGHWISRQTTAGRLASADRRRARGQTAPVRYQ